MIHNDPSMEADQISALQATWRKRGIDASKGCSPDVIRQFERNTAVSLTTLIRSYLLLSDGMAISDGRDFDDLGFSFWPLRQWTTASDELAQQGEESVEPWLQKAFVFADYMTRSWSYAVYLGHEVAEKYGAVFRIGSPGVEECAPSFEAFLQLYLENSRLLYGE